MRGDIDQPVALSDLQGEVWVQDVGQGFGLDVGVGQEGLDPAGETAVQVELQALAASLADGQGEARIRRVGGEHLALAKVEVG